MPFISEIDQVNFSPTVPREVSVIGSWVESILCLQPLASPQPLPASASKRKRTLYLSTERACSACA